MQSEIAALRSLLQTSVYIRSVTSHNMSQTCSVYSYPQIFITHNTFLLQFCAASEKDAKEWVEHIDFLIKGRTVHQKNTVTL